MSISLRLSKEEAELIRRYAEIKKLSVSDVVRTAILERIEDEFDLKIASRVLDEYKKNPVTYTLEEVESELGLK
jgi:uncharacterized protein (DUF1778 family)